MLDFASNLGLNSLLAKEPSGRNSPPAASSSSGTAGSLPSTAIVASLKKCNQ